MFLADEIGEALHSPQQRPEADCTSDHQLLIGKFWLKWKKVGKASRPFRYDLNQILYTEEVTNRFKGLGLVDRLPEELWMEVHNIVQDAGPKPFLRKINARRQSGYQRSLYK